MYRNALTRIVVTLVRGVVISAIVGALVGALLAGRAGILNMVILAVSFGLMGSILSLLGHFFTNDSRDENDLRWHRGGRADD